MSYPTALVLALLVGVLVTVQAGMLARMQVTLGSGLFPALASFAGGTAALLAYILAVRAEWPSTAAAAQVPGWLWLAGAVGAFFMVLLIVLAPRLGAGTLMALIVAGQLAAALMLDHFGALGFAHQPLSLAKLAGATLIVVGASLVQYK